MRIIFFFLISFIISNTNAQDLPSDSLILKKIYGKMDKGKKSFTRPFKEGEGEFSYHDSVTYFIAFKTKVILENQDLVLVIMEAPNTSLHGHQMGYRDIYFFKKSKQDWMLASAIVSQDEIPLGDAADYQISDIGKNKKALITTFQSTGNHHYESNKEIYYLSLKAMPYLLEVDTEYDNSAWNIPESENDVCNAESFETSYEIIPSDKEWYDIKVNKIEYNYTKGCKEKIIKSKSQELYIHNGKEYASKKK